MLQLHSRMKEAKTKNWIPELDTRIGKSSAVMRVFHYSVVMKQELTKKAKLPIFKPVFVPFSLYVMNLAL